MKRRTFHAATAVVALALLIPAVAIASPGFRVIDIVNRADGVLAGPTKVNIPDVVKFQTYGDLRVLTQELTIQPGGHTGWHSHPGPVLVTVRSGVFTFQEDDCSSINYAAGETVLDSGGGHIHTGRNLGTVNLDLSVTYLIPPGELPRIDVPAPDC